MEETGEEQQAWEPRDPEHVGKPWDWTCHLMCSLIIGDGICAERAWFWMKSNGGKFLRYWVPPHLSTEHESLFLMETNII